MFLLNLCLGACGGACDTEFSCYEDELCKYRGQIACVGTINWKICAQFL